MDYLSRFQEWIDSEIIDEDTKNELKLLKNNNNLTEIEDRFYRDLEFGTGGLRGIMGAGLNRMNKYIIGKATQGLSNYLKDKYTTDELSSSGVAVAFDTRNNSAIFAEIAANVLSSNGIKVNLFSVPVPTPELSFAVRHYNSVAGIVITASHNPKEYNGYKVYDEYGCQLVPSIAEKLISYVNDINDFSKIEFSGNEKLINRVDCTEEFVNAVLKQSVMSKMEAKSNLKIVYTPLHGTGNIPVRLALKKDGFASVNVVKSQELPDGNFPTVISPNPEERSALSLGIDYAKEIDADIVLGTDPDSDRVGVAVKTESGYSLLTGNQVGALLVDYICSKKDIASINKPALVKTIVTNELGSEISKKYGFKVFSTLTGFKFIGEKITQFEKAKENNLEIQDYTFVVGYEESYGYLVGSHARDKDAVVSSLLICEMAAEYKHLGKSLHQRLQELYDEFGFYKDALDSFTLKGKEGADKIKQMMNLLRNDNFVFENVKQVIDYTKDVEEAEGFGYLPKSNVLKFILNDDSWIAVRPSGTEPKIKIYYSVRGDSMEIAENKLETYRKTIKDKIGL